MNWRERIVKAKEQGWTRDDVMLWANKEICPAAEVALQYGVMPLNHIDRLASPWYALWAIGDRMGDTSKHCPLRAPIEVEQLMDEIEDRALQLKREASL